MEDEDVAEERKNVLSGEEENPDNVVVIRNLSKASIDFVFERSVCISLITHHILNYGCPGFVPVWSPR